MTLAELLPDLQLAPPQGSLRPRGLTLDSRRVHPGDLFLACPGASREGVDFIPEAVAAGAMAVLVDAHGLADAAPQRVPLIPLAGLKSRVAELAARFYGHPEADLDFIGVTGTNGKTSCCHFIAQALQQLGAPAALVGTNGYGFPGQLQALNHTTPDSPSLFRLLDELRSAGASVLAMEVSSHALDQGRTAGLAIEQGVFTNLTRDHLDYHPSFEAYGQAKARLFEDAGARRAVINVGDDFGCRLARQAEGELEVLRYALGPTPGRPADLRATILERSPEGVRARVDWQAETGTLRTPLLGDFNLANLLATAGVLLQRAYRLDETLRALEKVQQVAGRLQSLSAPGRPRVVIDYAHTPDALVQVLKALSPHSQGRVWCVFGCGGDRDSGKRPLMAAAAEAHAHHLVLTSDNPRHEDPEAILDQMEAGLQRGALWLRDRDRARAIARCLEAAAPEDLILIAGKGHEDYQQLGDRRLPYSDVAVVRALLDGRPGGTKPASRPAQAARPLTGEGRHDR